MSSKTLAQELFVPPNRIPDLVRERRSMTAGTALRLSRNLGTTATFWINLQPSRDLSKAEAEMDYSCIRTRAV